VPEVIAIATAAPGASPAGVAPTSAPAPADTPTNLLAAGVATALVALLAIGLLAFAMRRRKPPRPIE